MKGGYAMRLVKKNETDKYVIPKDLSISGIGLLNSLLAKSNDELSNIDLYSISNNTREETALTFRELIKKKYITYSSLDNTYFIHVSPQKK